MASTGISTVLSRVERHRVAALVVVAALTLMTAGCADLYGDATSAARDNMARIHSETVSCVERGIASDPGVDRMREVLERCVDTRREGTDPEYLSPGSFQEGSWLLSIDYEDGTWMLDIVDVGYAVRYQGEAENHRAVIQCWTTTVAFNPTTMTPPARGDCPSGFEDSVVGLDALEVDSLVTTAPSQE